ncbi:MAG TPA: hypothetical protein VFA75_08625 [Nevskia sp.]|nr:hypothetical protein [Nevskia sp.]
MRGTSKYPGHDPRRYAEKARATLDELTVLLRQDIEKVADAPKAQALFETAAEVLGGLSTAFRHYEESAEPAMREPAP